MLSVRPKITDLQFSVFARSIHPELIDSRATRTIHRENYLLTVNITDAGHLISFRHDNINLTEVSSALHHPLPKQRQLISHLADGPRADSRRIYDAVDYHCEFQLDAVTPQALVTIQQQLDDQNRFEGLLHRFESSGRTSFGAVSYIDIQSFRAHVQIRTFHTFPDTCAVLKSQSRFTVLHPLPID